MGETSSRRPSAAGFPKGVRLMDGSLWQDGHGIVAQPGSPEACVDTVLVGMSGNVPVGRDPRTIPAAVLLAEGFEPMLSKAVRAKCMDCATTARNVAECHLIGCPLWPFRMGSSPFKAKRRLTAEQRVAARERALKSFATVRGPVNMTSGVVAGGNPGTEDRVGAPARLLATTTTP